MSCTLRLLLKVTFSFTNTILYNFIFHFTQVWLFGTFCHTVDSSVFEHCWKNFSHIFPMKFLALFCSFSQVRSEKQQHNNDFPRSFLCSSWWHLCDGRHSFLPSCVTAVYTPRWCQTGHAEVKVSISREPGQLSHPCAHHCSNAALGRGCVVVLQSEDSAVRLITLFRTWCSYWTVWPKVTLTSYLLQLSCSGRLRHGAGGRLRLGVWQLPGVSVWKCMNVLREGYTLSKILPRINKDC